MEQLASALCQPQPAVLGGRCTAPPKPSLDRPSNPSCLALQPDEEGARPSSIPTLGAPCRAPFCEAGRGQTSGECPGQPHSLLEQRDSLAESGCPGHT